MFKISLPNDAQATGYKQTKPYHWEQVFTSATTNFTGTEMEFVVAGHGYKYLTVDLFTRALVA